MATEKEKLEIMKKLFEITRQNKTVLHHQSVKDSLKLIRSIELPHEDTISCPVINQKRITKIAQGILSEKFKTLNRQIAHANTADIIAVQGHLVFDRISDDELIRQLNSCAKNIDILKVPIKHNQTSKRNGQAVLHTLARNNPDFLRKLPIIASHIELGGPIDYLYALGYLHEIFHLLPQRFRGSIEDYYQLETLPIFIEKVTALELDSSENILATYEMYRNRCTQQRISDLAVGLISTNENEYQYTISTLIANCLFYRYYNETSNGRQYILSQVQTVLDGNKTLGQVLKEQAIDLSSSEVVTATEHSIEKCLIKK